MALLSFLGCTGSTVIYYIFDGRFRKRRSDMPPAKGFEWTPRAEGGLDRRPTIDQNSGVDVPEDPEPYEPEKDAIPVRQELVAPHRPFSNQYPEFPSSVTSSPLPQTIAESTMNEYRINQAPPPTATTRSSFYSECQEIEVPVSYKTSEVPILQRPKAPKNEISRWSATAASSAGGMTSAGSFGRTSWIGGDEARQIRQTYTKPSPVAEE